MGNNIAQLNFTKPNPSLSYRLRFRYRSSPPTFWSYKDNIKEVDTIPITISAVYDYQIMTICSLTDSSMYSAIRTFGMAGGIGPIPCQPPMDIYASNITQTSVTLNWTNIPTSTHTYIYFKKETEEYFNTYTVMASPVNMITINGLAANIRYIARVQGYCNVTGEYSPDVYFKTLVNQQPPCPQASNINITNITLNTANVNWVAATGALSYYVRYKVSGVSNWTTINTPNTYLNLTNLLSNTQYDLQIQSICPNNEYSSYTTIINFTTEVTPPPTTCDTPTGVSNSNPTTTAVELYWNYSGSIVINYEVQHRVQGTQNWITTIATQNTLYLQNLQNATKYEWRVRAKCSSGYGQYSITDMFRTKKQGKGNFIPFEDPYIIDKILVYDLLGREVNCHRVSYIDEILEVDQCDTNILIVKIIYTNGRRVIIKTVTIDK